MMIETLPVLVVAAAFFGVKKLIDLWEKRSMPEESKSLMSRVDKEKIAQTRELIQQEFGQDPVDMMRHLSNVERINKMDDFAKKLSQLYDLDIEVDVMVKDANTWGVYNLNSRKATFNIILLTNGSDTEDQFDYCVMNSISTIIHELRHAVQHRAVMEPGFWRISDERRVLWAENMCNYISGATDFRAYNEQPVEKDASTFESAVMEGVKKS